MPASYGLLARHYDALMRHAGHAAWADFFVRLLPSPAGLVLDLGCGTGLLTRELLARGMDVICVDRSEDMLSVARETCEGFSPLLLRQDMRKLDLYGTVDAAVSALDCFNYLLSPDDLRRVFARLRLFIRPGGVLLFDMVPPETFARMPSRPFVLETEEVFCVTVTQSAGKHVRHQVTLFEKQGTLWRRFEEWHTQRPYTPQEVVALLRESGFVDVRLFGDRVMRRPRDGEERIFFRARNG